MHKNNLNMSIIINKQGIDINSNSYDSLYVELNPFIEMHYDRVSIHTKCYNYLDVLIYGLEVGTYDSSIVIDASGNEIDYLQYIPPAQSIIPVGWERFNPILVPFELEASTNLESWSIDKVIEELTNEKSLPYEYMAYEDDVFELDPFTGEIILDPSTGESIIIHAKGELIKKQNGTYMFYNKKLPRFCEAEDVSINF